MGRRRLAIVLSAGAIGSILASVAALAGGAQPPAAALAPAGVAAPPISAFNGRYRGQAKFAAHGPYFDPFVKRTTKRIQFTVSNGKARGDLTGSIRGSPTKEPVSMRDPFGFGIRLTAKLRGCPIVLSPTGAATVICALTGGKSVPHPTIPDLNGQITVIATVVARRVASTSPSAPGGEPARQGRASFKLSAPKRLPDGVEGKRYRRYSVCVPPSAAQQGHCGTLLEDARNPSGGSPPYWFSLRTLGGSLPLGMRLGSNGVISGTPKRGTARRVGSPYEFTICARDNRATFRCASHKTRLWVRKAKPPQMPPGPPPMTFTVPAQLPEAVSGADYSYSFCDPPPESFFEWCGLGYKTTNPSGGSPPYAFGVPGLEFAQPLFPVPDIALSFSSGQFFGGSAPAPGTYRFTICARDNYGGGPNTICRDVVLVVRAPPLAGTYSGTIFWSWGPPIVSISPNPERISFTVRDSTISGALVGTVDSAGNATVQVTTFGSRGNISGTVRFAQSGSSVTVTGTVSGSLTTLGGTGRVEGRVRAERTSP